LAALGLECDEGPRTWGERLAGWNPFSWGAERRERVRLLPDVDPRDVPESWDPEEEEEQEEVEEVEEVDEEIEVV
jgi:hypothetical protein